MLEHVPYLNLGYMIVKLCVTIVSPEIILILGLLKRKNHEVFFMESAQYVISILIIINLRA